MAGLKIDDTIIDYPVMQTMEDEDYYLSYDFFGDKNVNGCLILDTDSNAGTGTLEQSYQDGTKPSTNLIIHGHTMKSHLMFGNLKLYEDEDYGKTHSLIEFDSLYEHRTYQLIAVFYSQVYYANQQVFKYYKFFIYGSINESGDDFILIASSNAQRSSGLTQIQFATTKCKRIKFVFDAADRDWASAREFLFFKEDAALDQMDDVFTNGLMN